MAEILHSVPVYFSDTDDAPGYRPTPLMKAHPRTGRPLPAVRGDWLQQHPHGPSAIDGHGFAGRVSDRAMRGQQAEIPVGSPRSIRPTPAIARPRASAADPGSYPRPPG